MRTPDELHALLLKAFNEYFKAYTRWLNKGTRIAGQDARYWLAQIRILAREERMSIQEWRHEVDAHKAQKKAQIREGENDQNAT